MSGWRKWISCSQTFMKEMDDDFNTANAISVLFELSNAGKSLFIRKEYRCRCYRSVFKAV